LSNYWGDIVIEVPPNQNIGGTRPLRRGIDAPGIADTDRNQKSIADNDINIEIEKYRRYRYSTNRYFCVDVNVNGDILFSTQHK